MKGGLVEGVSEKMRALHSIRTYARVATGIIWTELFEKRGKEGRSGEVMSGWTCNTVKKGKKKSKIAKASAGQCLRGTPRKDKEGSTSKNLLRELLSGFINEEKKGLLA